MTDQPTITTDTHNPDRLLAGDFTVRAVEETVITPENIVRGTLMGKITLGAATPAADGGNTGDGVLGAITLGALAQVGVYTLTCIIAVANAGTFEVQAPDGTTLPQLTVAVAYAGQHINGTLADGATDFIVGDKFTATVAAGSAKLNKSLAAAVDGSQNPVGIMLQDVNAAAADKKGMLGVSGDYNEDSVTFGAGHTAASVKVALRALGIHLVGPVSV